MEPEEKFLNAIFGEPVNPRTIRNEVDGVQLRDRIKAVLAGPLFTEREVKILSMRFGFDHPQGKAQTLDEVKVPFGVTRERIRQIEGKALRKLRHPRHSRQLKPYLQKDQENHIHEVDERVLTVLNLHVPDSGKPPDLTTESGSYTGYFENMEGEQLVFRYDYKAQKGTLWHGDYSWQHPVEIENGHAPLIMSREETTWLQLVWLVATSRRLGQHS